jgi:hypothetical protein
MAADRSGKVSALVRLMSWSIVSPLSLFVLDFQCSITPIYHRFR